MNRKIPQDAFGFYFSLGVSRSYGAVAEKYGVSKRAVALLASREQWQPRIAELERKARQRTDELALESRERTREARLLGSRKGPGRVQGTRKLQRFAARGRLGPPREGRL